MEKSPLVSICIPTFNRAKFLEECLENIVNQNGFNEDDIEVVISDNASPDNTESLVKSYQEKYPNIRYFKNNENIGANRNLFQSSKYAHGEYIWFMGDDDIIIDGGLLSVLKWITTCNDIVLFQTNMLRELDSMVIVGNGTEYFKELYAKGGIDSIKNIFLSFLSTILVKRAIFIDVLEKYNNLFIGDSYSHTCIFLKLIYNKPIGQVGTIINAGGDKFDLNDWKNNPKKFYNTVIVNGVDKFYNHLGYFSNIDIDKKNIDNYKKHLMKLYHRVYMIYISRRLGIFPIVYFLWKKFILKTN